MTACTADVIDARPSPANDYTEQTHPCPVPAHYVEPDVWGVPRPWCGHHRPSGAGYGDRDLP